MPLVPESVPVGLVVEMDLPELGLTDLAWVTDIADGPEIESRDSGRSAGGSVVTATFHHSSGDVIDLTLGSKPSTLAPPETIGTTSNHPFWSVDRQEYVQAGQLDVGERVLTFSGDTKRVVTKLPRPGPQPVYNLEVHAEHVYFVGEDGTLVHNAKSYSGPTLRKTGDGWEILAETGNGRRWHRVRGAKNGTHGNSATASGPHDLYALRDPDTGRVLHIGESGRGFRVREAEHRLDALAGRGVFKDANRIVDFDIEHLMTLEGKNAIRSAERRYIQTYRRVFGVRPEFNPVDH